MYIPVLEDGVWGFPVVPPAGRPLEAAEPDLVVTLLRLSFLLGKKKTNIYSILHCGCPALTGSPAHWENNIYYTVSGLVVSGNPAQTGSPDHRENNIYYSWSAPCSDRVS